MHIIKKHFHLWWSLLSVLSLILELTRTCIFQRANHNKHSRKYICTQTNDVSGCCQISLGRQLGIPLINMNWNQMKITINNYDNNHLECNETSNRDTDVCDSITFPQNCYSIIHTWDEYARKQWMLIVYLYKK